MKKKFFILIIMMLNILSAFSQIEIITLPKMIYGKHDSTYNFTIKMNGKELSDYELAKLTNDKKKVREINLYITKPDRIKKTGRIMFWTGVTAIVIPFCYNLIHHSPIIMIGSSKNQWQNELMFTGVCTSTIGYVLINKKAENFDCPEHYYNLDEAKRQADFYNFYQKKK